MCGIFCIYFSDASRLVEQDLVLSATNEMRHRGPDDEGVYISGNIGLGHRRLSIIDLASGHQPMFNEDGQIALVYNGEIYNHLEIREILVKKGHIFRTKSDTEVIIHAYEEWGFESVHKFNGMFAFALWDARKRSLWVVRDRLGIKPLYYHWDSHIFLCSSEIKPLLKTGFLKAEGNVRVLDAYLSLGYVPAPETMFKGIRKLRPGHFLHVKGCHLEEKEYWDFADPEPSTMSFEEAKLQIAQLLKDSVEKRLMSDVPLGVFLSGGLDSSAVVAIMSDLVNEPINTFTVGYDNESGVSEENYARIVAERFETRHHVFQLEPDDFFSSINTMVRYAEEPIVESAAIALYHIAKSARNSAIVLLSGEGSDEVFAGYLLYQFMNQLESLQRIVPPPLWQIFSPLRPLIPKMKYRKYFDWLLLPLKRRYQGTSSYLTESLRKEIYTPDFLQSKGDYLQETFSSHFDRVGHQSDAINKMLYVDTKTWLVDDLLLKADKMTMAASVELRVPFLDHRLVELAASLPSSFKSRNSNGKYILKSIMDYRLPREIVHRKKMGFPVPTKNWFSGALFLLIREQILDGRALPWVSTKAIRKIVKQHQNRSQDHSKLIMTLLVLTFWQEHYGVTP